MREKKDALVVTFAETTQAMAVETYCHANGLPGRIIPVPRAVTAGCGLAWKAAPADETALTAAFLMAGLDWENMVVLKI